MYCSNSCKCKYNNFHANNGTGYQTYENQKARGLAQKMKFINLKGGSCEKCGYNKCTAALTFHHREPEHKKFELEMRTLANKSEKSCLEELEKCDLLCFNCHMEVHYFKP